MIHNIVVIDDNPSDRAFIAAKIKKLFNVDTHNFESGTEFLAMLKGPKRDTIKGKIDVVLTAQHMPKMTGLDILKALKKIKPSLPVIMLTASTNKDLAIEAVKLGAIDFVVKPFEDDRLFASIENAVTLNDLKAQIKKLGHDNKFDTLIGRDAGLKEAIEQARKAASVDIPVLITGETGTGKAVLASTIHNESPRADGPFVTIRCGSIPPENREAALFGQNKEDSTGTFCESIGKLQEADGGTILLDEIEDLGSASQTKLLKLIQDKQIQPVGSSEPIEIDVRIIAATNRHLETLTVRNRFREDLYTHLSILEVAIPPLRKRQEDILPLIEYFIRDFCRNAGKPAAKVDDEAQKELLNYWWPGNVTELENMIHRALILSNGKTITTEHLNIPGDRRRFPRGSSTCIRSQFDISTENPAKVLNINLLESPEQFRSMDDIEREVFTKALEFYGENISRAAKALGVSRSTYYKKIQ